MERKTFILLSTLGGCSLSSPLGWFGCGPATPDLALGIPESLIQICDTDTLLQIGRGYIQGNPAENGLRSLADSIANELSDADAPGLKEQLQRQISREFETGKILQIEGWLLARTEARQCALYSLLKS